MDAIGSVAFLASITAQRYGYGYGYVSATKAAASSGGATQRS